MENKLLNFVEVFNYLYDQDKTCELLDSEDNKEFLTLLIQTLLIIMQLSNPEAEKPEDFDQHKFTEDVHKLTIQLLHFALTNGVDITKIDCVNNRKD